MISSLLAVFLFYDNFNCLYPKESKQEKALRKQQEQFEQLKDKYNIHNLSAIMDQNFLMIKLLSDISNKLDK